MKKMILPALIVCAVAVVLVLKFLLPSDVEPAPVPEVTAPPEIVTVVAPTCTEAGYTLYEDPQTGTIRIEDGEPARGHDFSADISVRTCRMCGFEELTVPPTELARIDLTGSMDGISKEQRVQLQLNFVDADQQFSSYAYTSWQGHSSLVYPKKNYMIRLFVDEALSEKNRLSFNGWQFEHKYALKANYTDATQCRNLICARVWGDMAASRTSIPDTLRRTSNYGATDGFPVSVWHDGVFHGLYTLNLHKDDDLYSMRKGGRDAIMICNAQTMDESLFRAEAVFCRR